MIDQNDPLVRLGAANPAPARDPQAAAASPAARGLLARIVATPVDSPSRVAPPRRRRRAWRAVPVVVVAGLVGAGAYALRSGDVTKPDTVACYEQADLQSRIQAVVVDARGPAAACADLWAAGQFGSVPVPSLVACTLVPGNVGVFPSPEGTALCARLGLPAPPSSAPPATTGQGRDDNARFLEVRDALLTQFLASPCVEPSAGRAIVRGELDRAGLADWTIATDQPFAADRPCASLAFHPERHEVVLVPSSPRR